MLVPVGLVELVELVTDATVVGSDVVAAALALGAAVEVLESPALEEEDECDGLCVCEWRLASGSTYC